MFLILGHYVFNEKITKNIILGIMMIIIGLYVIDNK
jgi:drug/metabolite transporter (DMT)-like permease